MALFAPSLSLARVLVGADQINNQQESAVLKGRRVALITNHTGVDGSGKSVVDLLHNSDGLTLVRILTPEHGFRGAAGHGEAVEDSIDANTGLPIFSLYGKTSRPTAEMLKDINTVVFDIQDIGTRFYTYIATMGMALEEAAKKKLRFVVLDRPNPVRGDIVEGDILDPDIKRMTGYFSLPTRHGLTVGEIAAWLNKTNNLAADLHVIKLKRWNRHMWFNETGLPFIPPSPNISSLTAALLYAGIGCFEAANISVGRGTDTPFELFGAPWIDAKALCSHLRSQNLPGFIVEPVEFTPEKDLYKGELCRGARILVTNRNTLRPFDIFMHSFLFLAERHPKDFNPEWEEIRVVTGSSALKDAVEGRLSMADLRKHYDQSLQTFKKEIEPFHLY